jgi:hypothetical protein
MTCAGLAPGEHVLDVACGTARPRWRPPRASRPAVRSWAWTYLAPWLIPLACAPASKAVRMPASSAWTPSDSSYPITALMLRCAYSDSCMCRDPKGPLGKCGGSCVRAVGSCWPFGENALRCGWAELFPIVDAEVASDVCPLFFHLGQGSALAELCAEAQLKVIRQSRITTVLNYEDDDEACAAALIGGPVALAWSRLDATARSRVRERYLASIARWRRGRRFSIPAQFVIVGAAVER